MRARILTRSDESPQRHREHRAHQPTSQPRRHEHTKNSQSRPPTHFCPQITQIDADDLTQLDRAGSSSTSSCRPSAFLTQRRKGAKTQSPPTHPPDFQRRDAEAQRRREIQSSFLCPARFRPSEDGREPLGRETVSKASSRAGFPTQWPALSKNAGLASSLLHLLVGRRLPSTTTT